LSDLARARKPGAAACEGITTTSELSGTRTPATVVELKPWMRNAKFKQEQVGRSCSTTGEVRRSDWRRGPAPTTPYFNFRQARLVTEQ
jgi:hypothetical protein